MSKLLLIKHSLPQIQDDVPSAQWMLSADGIQRCGWLAEQLKAHAIGRLFSSVEPKAAETARLAGQLIGLDAAARPDLHENDRTDLGFLDVGELRRRIMEFFANPALLCIGRETADTALARFSGAVERVLAEAAGADTAIVAHGTVITLFVGRYNQIPKFPFWDNMGLPSYVALNSKRFAFDGKIHNFPG